jgi:hypothetical protein
MTPPARKPASARPNAAKPARQASAMGVAQGHVRLAPGLGDPERRWTKWHFLGIGLLAFGLGYLVCRIADWAVTSDEERIVSLLDRLAAEARAGELPRLLEDVRLADFGFSAGGWGETWSFGANEEDKLLAKAREWSAWSAIRTLRIKADEDDVKVEGDRARASAELLFVDDDRPWRQPVRMIFRKRDDRWYVTGLELVRPDEILRP